MRDVDQNQEQNINQLGDAINDDARDIENEELENAENNVANPEEVAAENNVENPEAGVVGNNAENPEVGVVENNAENPEVVAVDNNVADPQAGVGNNAEVQPVDPAAFEEEEDRRIEQEEERLKKAEERREEYKAGVKEAADMKAHKYDIIKQVMGSRGKLYEGSPGKTEYDGIEIEVPNGLTEDQVTAIIIGAMMRPDRLDGQLTGSSFPAGSTTYVLFNSTFLLENLVKASEVPRLGSLPPILIEARKEAKQAIEAYKNGNPEPAKEMLNTFMDFYAQTSAGTVFHSESKSNYSNNAVGNLFGGSFFGKEPFNQVGKQSEILTTRAKAVAKMGELADASVDIKKNLLDNPGEPNSEARKQAAFDLLFNQYVANMALVLQGERNAAAQIEYMELLTKIRKETFGGKGKELAGENRAMVAVTDNMRNHAETSISDFEVILSTPEGVEKLKELYREEIIHTGQYEKLVSSQGNDLVDALIEADKVTERGITSFTHVQLDNVSKDMVDRAKAKHTENLKVIEDKIIDIVKENRHGLIQVDIASFEDNAKHIASYKKTLKDNTTWRGSSTNYRNLQRAIDALDKYAAELTNAGVVPSIEQIEQYIILANEAERLAGVYLDNKTNINSPYARKRVEAVREIRENLNINIKSFNDKLEELNKLEVSTINNHNSVHEKHMGRYTDRLNNFSKYDFNKATSRAAYFGENYSEDYLQHMKRGSYSATRTACFSITLAALAAEVNEDGTPKYTFDELMDPTKILADKQKMFAEVVKHIEKTEGTPEEKKAANEWLADKMYNGHKATWKLMDEQIKLLTLSDQSFLSTDHFARMMSMGAAMFDVSQEVAHCQEEIFAVAKKDGLNFDKIDDYQKYMNDHDGPYAYIAQSIIKLETTERTYLEYKEKRRENPNTEYSNYVNFFSDALNIKLQADTLMEWAVNGHDMPFSLWHSRPEKANVTERMFNITKNYAAMNFDMSNNSRQREAFDDIHDELLNGNLLSDVHLEVNPEIIDMSTIHGAPDADILVADRAAVNMPEDEMREQIAAVYKALKEKAEKNTNHDLEKYYKGALNSISLLSKDLLTEDVLDEANKGSNVRGYIRELVKLKWAEKYVGNEPPFGGDELDKAVKGAIKYDEAFNKDIEYIGYSTMAQYLFEDKADTFVASGDEAFEKGKIYSAKQIAKDIILGDAYNDNKISDFEHKVLRDNSVDMMSTLMVNAFVNKLIDDTFEERQDKDRLEFNEEELDKIKNATDYFKKWAIKDLKGELENNPEALKLLYDMYKEGTLLDKVNVEYHPSRVKVTGLDLFTDIKQELSIENNKVEADKAMERLQNPTYTTKKAFIKDAATVVANKVFAQTETLPKDIATGRKLTLKEYADKLTKSKEFVDSLRSKKDPGKMMNPKAFAKAMNNPEVVKKMILDSRKPANKAPSLDTPKAQNTRRRSGSVARRPSAGNAGPNGPHA